MNEPHCSPPVIHQVPQLLPSTELHGQCSTTRTVFPHAAWVTNLAPSHTADRAPVTALTAARRQTTVPRSHDGCPMALLLAHPTAPRLLGCRPDPQHGQNFPHIKLRAVVTHARAKTVTKPSQELSRGRQKWDWSKEGLGVLSS